MAYIPKQPNTYQGTQVIINSDRLLFNAKDDSVLMFADKAIGFNTRGTINFDTGDNVDKNKFVVNSPNIHLGLIDNLYSPTEPALLGDSTEKWLQDLISFLKMNLLGFFATQYIHAGNGAPGSPSPMYNLRMKLDNLEKRIEDIKSKNVKLV